MRSVIPKWAIVTIVVAFALVGVFVFYVFRQLVPPESMPVTAPSPDLKPVTFEVVGQSVEGRDISAHTFGRGVTRLLFVGGIHGGYEWNSVVLAYQFIDYLKANPNFGGDKFTITVIPSANPDGVFRVIGKEGRFGVQDVPVYLGPLDIGRLNANDVDLNRNFDCRWKPTSTWQSKTVSGGTSAFSEPESQAIRDYVLRFKPAAVVFWHSQSGIVYASECENGILPKTLDIMNAYAAGAGYKTNKSFDSYAITGDAEGWLASINIPAITVELKTHKTVEWEENLSGIRGLLNYFVSK